MAKRITYTEPESVVGGARKSGFSRSSHLFCGPSTVAPSEPRIASGVMSSSSDQAGSLGSSLAYGNVAVASGAETVDDAAIVEAADVGDDSTIVEDADADGNDTITEDADVDDDPAGAAVANGARSAKARRMWDADRMAISRGVQGW